MRRSDRAAAVAALATAGVLAAAGAGCSPKLLVVVDPDPCADGGTVGCVTPGLLDGLIGHWSLDERAGATTALDSSFRGNNGTLVDLDPATVWVPGRAGGGLRVDAAGYAQVARSDSIDSIIDAVTVAAWVYLDGSIVDWGTAISRQINDGYGQHYHLSLRNDERPSLFVVTTTHDEFLNAPDPVARATWVHLAGTYDGENARLYVDGELADTRPVTGTFAPETTPVILAGNGNGPDHQITERFPGRLDDIVLYRRALSAEEIRRLHGGALFPPGTPADAGAGGD